MDGLVIQLVVGLIMGAIVSAAAKSKGRNAVGWFFIGAFTGCIGLILVLVLPDLKHQAAKFSKLRGENRRMREELRLNRQVADKRHEDVSKRLGVHDRALGVETGTKDVRRIEARTAQAPPPLATVAHQWWYESAGERVGPVSAGELRNQILGGTVTRATLVWRKGMDDWLPARQVDDLRELLGG